MNNKNLAVVLFAAVMTITIGMQPVYAQTASGTATVEPKTCGLNLISGNIVSFGSLIDGTFAPGQNNLNLNNTGNADGVVSLVGQDWKEQANQTNTLMLVNQTHFAISTIPSLGVYDSAIQLNTTASLVVGSLPPNLALPVFFGVVINLIDSLFTGAINQQMTFSTECV